MRVMGIGNQFLWKFLNCDSVGIKGLRICGEFLNWECLGIIRLGVNENYWIRLCGNYWNLESVKISGIIYSLNTASILAL